MTNLRYKCSCNLLAVVNTLKADLHKRIINRLWFQTFNDIAPKTKHGPMFYGDPLNIADEVQFENFTARAE